MPTPATELQKLIDLRDAGELTETEFEMGKARLLRPAPEKPVFVAPRRRRWTPFESLGRGVLTILVAMGLLIGGTTLIALTEAGALALFALAALSILLILIWSFQHWF